MGDVDMYKEIINIETSRNFLHIDTSRAYYPHESHRIMDVLFLDRVKRNFALQAHP